MRVLIDDANGRIREELLATLMRAGHTVEVGTAHVSARRFDVAVVSSAKIAERLRREHPAIAVVVFTRSGDVEVRIRALELGADDAIDGSFPMAQSAARNGAAGHRAARLPRHPERIEIGGCAWNGSAPSCSRCRSVTPRSASTRRTRSRISAATDGPRD